ncbi:hypothetical protein HELRODRAFT_178273 [Helobdella robusta]|uniref:Uncharacterized protein n=1 Tax=Helobdella robusta TaxID=6412 RepID=T1FD07_HELRO|nr:hypothetical protein HELRODRAFT_178273 [Helobdella robusta]ESN97164.1 hypothetical protein HELRODRAFT_178273 [Helobdella robusta]
MPILTGCCCFGSLKNGSRASAVFTLVSAIINIIIDIVALKKMYWFITEKEPQEKYLYLPPGIVALVSIELVSSIAMIPVSLVLLIGINYAYEGRKMIFAWIGFMCVDRMYDFFLGVYTLAWIGGHRFRDVLYTVPESIVVSVYWLIDSIILIAAILCVISYWQELKDYLFGKERRVKHYNKLANIRQAALSGQNTPYKSYYSSRSLLALDQSQHSLNFA